jgi:hypothetical protein
MKKLSFLVIFFFGIGAAITSCQKDAGELSSTDKVTPQGNATVSQPQHTAELETFCEGGEDEEPEPMIYGAVFNTDSQAVAGACVALTVGNTVIANTGTDSHGHYFFNSASNGTYTVRITATGYVSQNLNAHVVSQVPDEVNFTLVDQ